MLGMILVGLLAGDGGDLSEAARIGVLHEGRVKPLDTFARELMQFLSEKENFKGFEDPATGEWVEVVPDGNPVGALLGMLADPLEASRRPFLKITHPGIKEEFGLPPGRTFYSMADFTTIREKMMQEASRIDQETATSRDRTVLKILHQFTTLQALHRGSLFAIIPIPSGEDRSWMTPQDVRRWLEGGAPTSRREQQEAAALAAWVGEETARREALREAVDGFEAALRGWREGNAAGFAGLAGRFHALNPEAYPSDRQLTAELHYNAARPFHRASLVYFLAALTFLIGLAFRSRWLRPAALVILGAGVAITVYGYVFRWIIAGRYPLSNHYESMVMCALAAGLIAMVLEPLMKVRHLVGLGGALVSSLLLVLANNVPSFAQQGFVAPLVPALQTVWMTIHVPIIMAGYAMGMLLAVLAHVHLVRIAKRPYAPEEEAEHDGVMNWILRLTTLFLLLGIVLGAVWAGEAWGRPWGWDMKETWALITLLCYLAVVHGRFTKMLRLFGTSVCAVLSLQVLILTYYGVNFLFGKGLHTYGFGAGEWGSLLTFFAFEAAFLAVTCGRVLVRKGPPTPEGA